MNAADLLTAAKAKGVMLATAESCTGGMLSAAITDIPGSSAIFDRAFVTYTNAAKMQMLDVKQATLDAYGAVSEEVAAQMAKGVLAHSNADIAVAITGIAGPGGSEHKPEGRVCFAVAGPAGVVTETVEFGALGRDKVRAAARDHGLALFCQAITMLHAEDKRS
ncbi:CinA family protein [Roseobacter sp. CCS2]|uniref:CinA family protein n=1 Tax=Roseobacter sp. CCS2 TaxID=391593 RepID=UPI0000F3E57F|nr:CinA family protein [Roseobacter sp. CCS2]EBA10985.1 competence/damage-inducible protein CinA domain protein [Roseobacter sp. CCS2]